ncbi:XPG-I domain and 5'-3' exonuclease, C-terminal domain-containing protein [Strongyloides ratti]|uniref:XPG-I domain and 5'-3' exonuclease, C-terminal domain-containing protein n=1 Tax=Strongyloides ratti TaxID=34506 RepID=A0A090L753_STRRB|nr:XPG-I domain and 5'-3' exonuclease, C-terminal domain-containing protein [Strongyloides ratti]CEF65562.1 XPG-I domain and 5'-3' exonuclease, C-terminal domain-containing protein [Strongyloides ratti]
MFIDLKFYPCPIMSKPFYDFVVRFAEPISVSELFGQTVVIDGTSWVFEIKGTTSLDRRSVGYRFVQRICKLVENNINPIVFFEEMDVIKKKKNRNSKSTKNQTYNPAIVDVFNVCQQLKVLLTSLRISTSTLQISSCKQAALMEYNNKCSGIITKDPEFLYYGGRKLYIMEWGNEKEDITNVKILSMDTLEREYSLYRNRLIAIGMFLGCDALPGGFPNIGTVIALEIVSEFTMSEDDAPLTIYERYKSFMKKETITKGPLTATLNKLARVNFYVPNEFTDNDDLTKRLTLYLMGSDDSCDEKYLKQFPFFTDSITSINFHSFANISAYGNEFLKNVMIAGDKLLLEGKKLISMLEDAVKVVEKKRIHNTIRTNNVYSPKRLENIRCSKREIAALKLLRAKDEYYIIKSEEYVESSESVVAQPSTSGSNNSSPTMEPIVDSPGVLHQANNHILIKGTDITLSNSFQNYLDVKVQRNIHEYDQETNDADDLPQPKKARFLAS